MQQTLHPNPQARRVDVDEEARAALPPAASSALTTPTKDPARVHANALAARRFITRVNGQDLRHELGARGISWHGDAWLRWITAPIDPLPPEQAATVGVGAARPATRRPTSATYVRNEIRPVAMTLERAIAIAQAAQDAVDNGTVPTYT